MIRKIFVTVYVYFMKFPDRMYPFACEIKGRRVRGVRSYERAAARAFKKYGVGRLGYRLTFYREIFHFVGSVLFIILATYLSKHFFGSDMALYTLSFGAIVALALQEFYFHPKHYNQHFWKGITDWSVWVLPIFVYVFHLPSQWF